MEYTCIIQCYVILWLQEQYKFCHETVLEFIHQFDRYSNLTECQWNGDWTLTNIWQEILNSNTFLNDLIYMYLRIMPFGFLLNNRLYFISLKNVTITDHSCIGNMITNHYQVVLWSLVVVFVVQIRKNTFYVYVQTC
jgi:hypothetical protein